MSGRAATINIIPGDFALSVGKAPMSVPKRWEFVALTDVARLESGHTPSRSHPEYWDGDIPWIGIRDAREHHGSRITETQERVTPAGIANSAARILPAGTVCLSRTASVGYVTVMGRDMATSQDFVNWVCSERLLPEYLQKLFIAERQALLRFSKGSTHSTIYFPEVKAFHISLPPLDEQRRIVAKLDALQEKSRRAREALDAVPPLLDKLRQSILAAAFRGDLTKDWRTKNPRVEPAHQLLERIRRERRLRWEEAELAKLHAKGKPPKDDRWKDKYVEPKSVDASELPELPEGWCWASLEEVALLVTGGTPPGKETGTYGSGLPFVKPTDLDAGRHVRSARQELTEHGAAFLDRLPPGTTLITSIGATIGKVGYAEVACAVNQQINAAIPTSVDPVYLYWSTVSHQAQAWIHANASATTLPIINKGRLAGLPVPMPPADEQVQIVEEVDARISALAALSGASSDVGAEIGSLNRALLAKAFRGEL